MDFDLNEKLSKEVNERNSQVKLLQQEIKEEADKQRKFVNDFRDKVVKSNIGHSRVQSSNSKCPKRGPASAIPAR
jgi:DNA-binding protein H-NS